MSRLVWITGAAGAGKSTLARALLQAWPHVQRPLWLDGDRWREILGPLGAGYAPGDRTAIGSALARLALELVAQGTPVIASTISRHAQVGAVLDDCAVPQLRVRVRAPLQVLCARRPGILQEELAGMAAEPWPYRIDLELTDGNAAAWVRAVLDCLGERGA